MLRHAHLMSVICSMKVEIYFFFLSFDNPWRYEMGKNNKEKKISFDSKYLTILILIIFIMILLGIMWDFNIFNGIATWLAFDNIFWAVAITIITSVFLLFLENKLFKVEANDSSKELVEDIKRIVDENNQTIIHRLNLYSPIKSYPASDTPIDDFNGIINREFVISQTYRYMGDRAEYLTYRLEQLKSQTYNHSRGLDIEILLPHIANDYFVISRVDSLKRKEPYIGIEDIEELKDKLVKDYKIGIIKSLWVFYHLSSYYQFNIYFYDDLPFIRYEILDNVMVLSLLTMDSQKKYPPTFIYSKESAYYNAFSQHHYNMVRMNKDKGHPHFDNSTLNIDNIISYALSAGISAEEVKEVLK